MEMLPNQRFSRINTLELKSMIIKKIGHVRAEKYFELIRRLFSLKITKCEFNKFCIRIIGRDNLPLHNRLIRSIIKNAHLAQAPPLPSFRKPGSNLTVKVASEYKRNGDANAQSPLTGRSAVTGDHKFSDHPSPLEPIGKSQGVTYQKTVSIAQVQKSATELFSLGSRPPIEVASVEDGEEVEQASGSPSVQSRSPVTAPYGVSMNLSRKFLHNASVCRTYHLESCQSCSQLPDTRSLRNRLERKWQMEGMHSSADCVNLLNNGLDAYLKRLIEPCIRLAEMRQREIKSTSVTMLDFRAALELNPLILGEDWSVLIEKIFMCSSED